MFRTRPPSPQPSPNENNVVNNTPSQDTPYHLLTHGPSLAIEIKRNKKGASPQPSPQPNGWLSAIAGKIKSFQDLYDTLIDSTKTHTLKTTHYPDIPFEKMLVMQLSELNDEKRYEVGFSRKYCTISIHHASLVFRDPETEEFLIIGRQNEAFLKPNPNDPELSFSRWVITYLVANPTTFWKFPTTRMDNEKRYHFFPGNPFSAEMSDVLMTGAEIKKLILAINEKICEAQSYNLVQSNCYSAVLYGLTQAIQMVANRVPLEEVKRITAARQQGNVTEEDNATLHNNNKDLKHLFTLICSAVKDNFKLGLGSMDNPVVDAALRQAIETLKQRPNVLKILDDTQNNTLTTSQGSSVGSAPSSTPDIEAEDNHPTFTGKGIRRMRSVAWN